MRRPGLGNLWKATDRTRGSSGGATGAGRGFGAATNRGSGSGWTTWNGSGPPAGGTNRTVGGAGAGWGARGGAAWR